MGELGDLIETFDYQVRSKWGRSPQREQCQRGHPFTAENTLWALKNGKRVKLCRTCRCASKTKYNRKVRAD